MQGENPAFFLNQNFMKTVLIATDKPFAPVAIHKMGKIIRKAGYKMNLLEKYASKQELLYAIRDADAVIVRSDIVDAEVIGAAKNLKIVVRAGAGYDNVDLKAATEKGAVVMNEPDLVRIMSEKPGIKYMSDVAPDCKDEFAVKFEGRYFFTPKKAGAQTEEANLNAGLAAVEQIADFFEKGNCMYQVNG